jgi:hypothetical protein
MIADLKITHEAYPYLVAQRGALDDMKGDPETWSAKYCDVLSSEFRSIEPHLPKTCHAILDVGSGMGGIDALINAHFGGDCEVCLLDGVDDPPAVELHGSTFNNMRIAKNYLELNGVKRFAFIDANDAHRHATVRADLVVSFKSWCFHYAPERYLDLVLLACHPETVLILDIRRDRPEWLKTVQEHFLCTDLVYAGIKFCTYRFIPK